MKHVLLIFIATLFSMVSVAQQSINYKALIKDDNGDVMVNQTVTIQFQILEAGTTNIYQETHINTTDVNGIIVLNIGEGTVNSGNYLTIDWGVNDHFLNVQVDTGNGLVDLGTTQFMSVPYANFAEDTRKGTLNDAYNKGGNGAGRTINAANGKVKIDGDGLVIAGNSTLSSPQLALFEDNTGFSRLRYANTNRNGNDFWDIAGFIGTTTRNDKLTIFNSDAGNILTLTGDGTMGVNRNNPRGALDINSTNNGGLILPTATTTPETDILNTQNPSAPVPYGTLVYDAFNNCLSMYKGGLNEGWVCVSEADPSIQVNCSLNGLTDTFQQDEPVFDKPYSITLVNPSETYDTQPITLNYNDVTLSGDGQGTIGSNAFFILVNGVSVPDGDTIIIPANETALVNYYFDGEAGPAGGTIDVTYDSLGNTCTDSTIVLDPAAPNLRVRMTGLPEVEEGDLPTGNLYTLDFSLSGGTAAQDIEINVTHNATNTEVTPTSQTVTILAGQISATVNFTLVGDEVLENDVDVRFEMSLISGPNPLSLFPSYEDLTILDDELPTLNVGYFDADTVNITSYYMSQYKDFITENFGTGKTISTKGNGVAFRKVNYINLNDTGYTLAILNTLDLDIIWVNSYNIPGNGEQAILNWANNTSDGGVVIASLINDTDDELLSLFGHGYLETHGSVYNPRSTNNSYLTSGVFGDVLQNTGLDHEGDRYSITLGTANNAEEWADTYKSTGGIVSYLPSVVVEDRGVFLSNYRLFGELDEFAFTSGKELFIMKVFAFAVSKIGQ